jgi:DNA-binding SARP family transcriptional activator
MDTSIGRGGVRRVRSLGIVDLVTDGVARPVPGPRRRALLVVLALAMGEVVSTGSVALADWMIGQG